MKRIIASLNKIEQEVDFRTYDHLFIVVHNKNEYEQIINKYENDEKSICVIFKLYKDQ